MSAAASASNSRDWIRGVQAVGLTLLVSLVALPMGGLPSGARAALVSATVVLVALEWLPRIWCGEGPDDRERSWLNVWVIVSALVLLQLAPLPHVLLEQLGAAPPAFRELADFSPRRLSPTPGATASYWAMFTTYWAACLMAARLSRRQLLPLVLALLGLSVFEAFYGMFALVRDLDSILGLWPKQHYLHDATGTFTNRNHFAGLLALSWPFGLAVILGARGHWQRSLPRLVGPGVALLYSLLVGVAICASHSRAGLVAALTGLAAWLLVARRGSGDGPGVPRWVYWAAPAAGLVAAVAISGELATERFARLFEQSDRLRVWAALLDLPGRTWLLGAGAASFSDVFKTVQPAELRPSYLHAHSEYVELVFDFGLLGTMAIALCAWAWWQRVRPRHPSWLQAGAFGGIAAVAVHCLVDFDLQIPGLALPFWVLLGLAVNENLADGADTGPAASAVGQAEGALVAR